MTDDMTPESEALIDSWFPVAAVDEACGTPAGSGQNEKALFTWFASRPIAQARAAVLGALLPDGADDSTLHDLVERAIRVGDEGTLERLAGAIPDANGKRPVVLDCFSGRGIIPLEAARLGLRSVGTDLSPVAVLASRLLSDYALRDWSSEGDLPFRRGENDDQLFAEVSDDPKLVRDLQVFFEEVGRRVEAAVDANYPRNQDGTRPWGYLWATTIPCDQCKHRFPLVGSLVLRHPYVLVGDVGQHFVVEADPKSGTWDIAIKDGVPTATPTMAATSGKRGKSARCPFCEHLHPLDTVKAKGFAGQYRDAPIAVADLTTAEVTDTKGRTRRVERKVFRRLTDAEKEACVVDLATLPRFGTMTAAPTERIAPGNASTVDATGYGYKTWASLMNDRQCLQFIETARAIRSCRAEAVEHGISPEYATALAAYAGANLVRRLRRATRGVSIAALGKPDGSQQNRNKCTDLFANESGVNFAFDWFETGPALGPGTWASLSGTTLKPLRTHIMGLGKLAAAGTFRVASATALPYRDGSVDVVVCDPPYYDMINYADVSDLFYVWLRRCLFDLLPDLFGASASPDGLQDKTQEIVVKQGKAPNDHRTPAWYEEQLSRSFEEMRRVLKRDGTLAVVFGHSDPAAWRRLLGALRDAGFVVTSAWPARTESANTGVASIKVTVTIGCRVPPAERRTETAATVEREIVELIRKRVPKWEKWGLALSDQLMAAYGPAMQVVGRYKAIQRPDGTEPDLDHFLTVGRRAVADAHAFRIDELPLETFDPETRFSLFWLRAHQRGPVAKGEAVFEAQASGMRIDEVRDSLLKEIKGGYGITLDAPPKVTERSPVIHVARALGHEWGGGGTDGAAAVLADSGRGVDDQHIWATVGELVRQLPESDALCKSLTACQRNRNAIESAARLLAQAADQEQLPLAGGVE